MLKIITEAKLLLPKVSNEALHNADALIIATEWNEFRAPDFQKIQNRYEE